MRKRKRYVALVLGTFLICLGTGCGQKKPGVTQQTTEDPLAAFEDAFQENEEGSGNNDGFGIEIVGGIEDYNIAVSDGKASFTMSVDNRGSDYSREVGILLFEDGVPAMFAAEDGAEEWMHIVALQPGEQKTVSVSLETPIPSAESKAKIHVVAVNNPGYKTTKENVTYGNNGSIVPFSYPFYVADVSALEQQAELKQAEIGTKDEHTTEEGKDEEKTGTSLRLVLEGNQPSSGVHGRQELSQLMVQASGLEKGTYYVSLWIDWKPVTAFAGQFVGEIKVEDPDTQYLLKVDLPEDMDLDISDLSTISAIVVPEDGFTFTRTTGSIPYWE